MPISISLDLPNIGVPATFWAPVLISADLIGQTTTVVYNGWISAAAYAAGSAPIEGDTHTVTLNSTTFANLVPVLSATLATVEAAIVAMMQAGSSDLFAGAALCAAPSVTAPTVSGAATPTVSGGSGGPLGASTISAPLGASTISGSAGASTISAPLGASTISAGGGTSTIGALGTVGGAVSAS